MKGIIIEGPPEIKPLGVQNNGDIVIRAPEPKPEEKKEEKKDEAKPEDKAAEKAADDASLESAIAEMKKELGFYKEKPAEKKAEEKKDEKKPEEKAADKVEEKPKEEKKPARKPSESKVTPEMVDTVAQAAARAAVEASKSVAQPREEKPGEPELSVADQRDYEVLRRMEKDNPDKYRGVTKQFVKYVSEFDRYRGDWERENPDKAFDPEDKEHAQFYARNEPKYESDDFDQAKMDIRLDARLKEKDKESEEKLGKLEAQLAEQQLGPKIAQSHKKAIDDLVGGVDKDMAAILAKDGPAALQKHDPIAFDVLDNIATNLKVVVAEIEKLAHPSGRFRFDPKNPAHQHIDRFAGKLEQEIKGDADRQWQNGKMFATQAEFRKVPEAQRSRYWTLDLDAIREELVKSASEEARTIIEAEHKKVDRYLEARGLKATKVTGSTEEKKEEKKPEPGAKHKSPAAAAESISSPRMDLEKLQLSPETEQFVKEMFPA